MVSKTDFPMDKVIIGTSEQRAATPHLVLQPLRRAIQLGPTALCGGSASASIKRRFKQLAAELHPDRSSPPDAAERFRLPAQVKTRNQDLAGAWANLAAAATALWSAENDPMPPTMLIGVGVAITLAAERDLPVLMQTAQRLLKAGST
eukprot:633711-Pleurochrysis_carterae.AAC.4